MTDYSVRAGTFCQ